MKIIAYQHTALQCLLGDKTVTRRIWNVKYARQFKAGEIVQAWDRSPRVHGQKFGEQRLLSLCYESIGRLEEDSQYARDELAKEGYPGVDAKWFIDKFFKDADWIWRVEFEMTAVAPHGVEMLNNFAAKSMQAGV